MSTFFSASKSCKYFERHHKDHDKDQIQGGIKQFNKHCLLLNKRKVAYLLSWNHDHFQNSSFLVNTFPSSASTAENIFQRHFWAFESCFVALVVTSSVSANLLLLSSILSLGKAKSCIEPYLRSMALPKLFHKKKLQMSCGAQAGVVIVVMDFIDTTLQSFASNSISKTMENSQVDC